MPELRRLSDVAAIEILAGFGFGVHAQAGSHVKLRRTGTYGEKQTLTIPRHKELDSGTLRAIFRQASQYISELVAGSLASSVRRKAPAARGMALSTSGAAIE